MKNSLTYKNYTISVLEDFAPLKDNTFAIKAVYTIEQDKQKSKVYFTDSAVTFKNWDIDYDFETSAKEAITFLIDNGFSFDYDYYFWFNQQEFELDKKVKK